MRITSPQLSIILAIVLLIVYSSCEKTSPDDRTKFKHVTSFPIKEDSIFLNNPVNFTFSNNSIFISDQGASKIYVFDFMGNLKKEIGRKGSGPKEFMMLGEIEYQDNCLFINDFGNGRFTVLELDSINFESFFPQQIPTAFSINNRVVFMDHLIRGESEDKKYPLIWIYDLNMELKTSFGSRLDFISEMPPDASSYFLEIFNDNIYILFEYYPTLRKYSMKGDLLSTIHFEDYYKEKIKGNYKNDSFSDPSILNLRSLFTGFDVTKSGLFFTLYDEDKLLLDHFDHGGDLVKHYEQDIKSDTYYVRDMKVLSQEKGTLSFYLLNLEDGVPKVDVYEAQSNRKQTASLQ